MPFLDFFGGIVLVVFGIDPGYAIVGWGAINFQSNTYKTLGYGELKLLPELILTNGLSTSMTKPMLFSTDVAPTPLQSKNFTFRPIRKRLSMLLRQEE